MKTSCGTWQRLQFQDKLFSVSTEITSQRHILTCSSHPMHTTGAENLRRQIPQSDLNPNFSSSEQYYISSVRATPSPSPGSLKREKRGWNGN